MPNENNRTKLEDSKMEQKRLVALTDEQLLVEAKKTQLSPLTKALFIGFLIGIVMYSVVKNGFGFFLVFPLFFAYKLVKNSQKHTSLEAKLKSRELK